MKLFNDEIRSIAQEIRKNYNLEENMVPLGFRILCRKDHKNCLTLTENFFYMSKTVKSLYAKIDSYCEMIETYPGELDRYNSNFKDSIQKQICNNLITLYNL